MKFSIPFFTFIFLSLNLLSQNDQDSLNLAKESLEQTMKILIQKAETITKSAAEEIASKDTWEPQRERRKTEMLDMLGLWPIPEKTPLKAKITGTLKLEGYRIEKLAFESLPQVYVTANLYIPNDFQEPLPAVVYVCGHAFSPYGNKAAYQRHGISLAKNGYVALILDSIQVAETFALHHGIYNQEMYEWYSRGYTPAGVEVWNAIRAIDYLETRAEVDPSRIGMTGRSGGAAMTWFTACVDPRIKVAVPVMGISTYAANLREDTQKLHCDCMFTINSYRHDMLHQGSLIAPRPLLMMHGSLDALFPVAGYEEFEERIGRLYQSYGVEDAFQNIVVETKHEDSEFLRGKAIDWFDRFLKQVPQRELDLSIEELDHRTLAVFPDGPPADAQNFRVHETFIETPRLEEFSSLKEWDSHRERKMTLLKEKVFGAFKSMKASPQLQLGDSAGWYFKEATFESEPGMRIHALLHLPENIEGKHAAVLYVASDGEDATAIQQIFSQSRNPDNIIRLVVYPRGIGEVGWKKSVWKSLLRNAMHVGHTVDSLRVWDVLQGIKVLRLIQGVDLERITVLGSGVSGILGLYAAILDPQVSQVFLINAPDSHIEEPIFLNVMRYLELPEAAALLAPRRLNFYSRMPEAFQAVLPVYGLYGKPDSVHTSMDIEAVLQGRYNHNFASGR